jgi:hypothetical protein
MPVRVFVFAVMLLATASTSLAQTRQPISRFVIDVRGASTGLPTDEGWTPTLPANTLAPSRKLGLDAGAHVFVLRLKGLSFGIGGNFLYARGTTIAPEPVSTSPTTPPPVQTIPDVTTGLTSVAPQVSMNFGHSLGWSYLSAGLGTTQVESEAAIPSQTTVVFTPRDSGWVKTINFGGGARWFIKDRFGVGFDVRWYKLSTVSASATHPGAPRASLLTAGVGIALR